MKMMMKMIGDIRGDELAHRDTTLKLIAINFD